MKTAILSPHRPAGSRLALPALLVTPEWLSQHLEHPALRLLDVRPAESYATGHLPGAARVDLDSLACTVDDVPGMLLPPERFAAEMGRLGIDPNSIVVIYDDHWGMPASRVLWALACYGHPQAAVLTGGWDRWQEEGRAWTVEPAAPLPANFKLQVTGDHSVPLAWLLDQLQRPDLLMLDTRSPGEYAGGHLPGAICWDWMNGVPLQGWGTLRPAPELRAELEHLGVTPDKEIVTYCRSGARAAHTYLLLRYLGYPRVRLYDGSWLEWSIRVSKEAPDGH